MHDFEIKLWDEENIPYVTPDAEVPNTMRGYLAKSDKPVTTILVIPGGGYWCRAAHEGDPMAEYFNDKGFNAFVVDYRIKPNKYPAPQADAQRAIKHIRKNAKAWNVDTDKIVVLGFSAGGHLAACCGVLEDFTKNREGADDIDRESAKVNGMVLCYPVIHMFEDYGHPGSPKNLCGDDVSDEMRAYLSLENRVTPDTPPVFIWHTSDDACVNVKNSLVFGEKLRDNGVPFEMHIYPHGPHGLGIGRKNEEILDLAELIEAWIRANI